MSNACVFDKEEKLPMTKLAKVLIESNRVAFTICFHSKADEKSVKEKIESYNKKEFYGSAKDLLVGKQRTVVGRLSKAEHKLGRSLVISLQNEQFL